MTDYPWLPEALKYEDYDNDQNRIIEAAYAIFKNDFIDSSLEYIGKKIIAPPELRADGKHECFWHIVSEKYRSNRIFSIDRCVRINWPRALIDNASIHDVLVWKTVSQRSKSSKREMRLKIALSDYSYIIILREQSTCYILVTAYPVDQTHTILDLVAEYENFRNLA